MQTINTNVEDIKLAQSKNEEAMTKIINDNSGLIWSIVKRFLGRGYAGEELYQIGCIGFIKSIQRFNTELELKISTYAVPYIMGEIKKFLRDDGPIKISRSLKELSMKINQASREYMENTGEEISLSALAKKLEVSKEEIAMAIESSRQVESIDLQSYEDDEQGESRISKINVQKDETSILIDKLALGALIKDLEKRDKEIIMLRYYKEKTQCEVARILGITQVQVSRLEKRILLNMRNKIDA